MNRIRIARQSDSALSVFPELEPVAPETITRRRAHPASLLPFPKRPNPVVVPGIRTTVLSFRNMNDHGDLLVKFLMSRRETFIDRLKWDLPVAEGMEFDQYDTPQCRWVVLHEFGEVLGGFRLAPTTAQCGIYSYMLRDAQRGLLHSIPRDVLFFEAPVEERTWEASRLFISENVPAPRRIPVQTALMQGMIDAARQEGALHVIGIVPAVFARWLRRLDLAAVPVGPKFTIDGTSSQAALFNVAQNPN